MAAARMKESSVESPLAYQLLDDDDWADRVAALGGAKREEEPAVGVPVEDRVGSVEESEVTESGGQKAGWDWARSRSARRVANPVTAGLAHALRYDLLPLMLGRVPLSGASLQAVPHFCQGLLARGTST